MQNYNNSYINIFQITHLKIYTIEMFSTQVQLIKKFRKYKYIKYKDFEKTHKD